jgi:hypothetical protein
VEQAGYEYRDVAEALGTYDARSLSPGHNHVHGEDIFFVQNPALGLWATRDRFREASLQR